MLLKQGNSGKLGSTHTKNEICNKNESTTQTHYILTVNYKFLSDTTVFIFIS